MKKLFFTIFFLVLIPFMANAASIKAVVDRTAISSDDTITLSIIINDGKSDVDVSAIRDFKIISKSSGSNYQWINGETINEFKLNYVLVPLKKGRLIVPSFSVKIKRQLLSTDPIIVNVKDTPVSAKDKRDVFVTANVSEKNPFEGQQIIYTFALYNAVQISGPSLQIPEFTDFIVKEEDDEINRSVIVGGRQYNVIEKKLILIPTKSGQYTIAPAVLNCNVAIKDNTRRNDPFDSLFNDSFFRRSRMKRKILRTNTLGLNVKKLPAYPFDFNFSGVVGRVSMSASIEEKKLKAGDSTTFTIIIKGNGNIMDAEEPFVDVPEGFKVYKDNPEEEIKKGIKGYSGKKIFRMAIVAVESGKYTIPKIKSSYFDVHSGKYRLLEAGPFSISVSPSQPENFIKNEVLSADNIISQPPRIVKKKVEYTGHDLLSLKENIDELNKKKQLPFIVFIILLIFPAVLTALAKIILVLTQRDAKASSIMSKRADLSLKKAGKPGLSEEEFLSNIYKAFISIIFSKASVAGESLTTMEAREILLNANYSEELIVDAEQLIGEIESIRFSGQKLNDTLRKNLLDKIRKIIRKLK